MLRYYIIAGIFLWSCEQFSSAPMLTENFETDALAVIEYLNEKEEDGVITDDLYYKRAEAYYQLDSTIKALRDVDSALVQVVENSTYHFLKGNILDKMNRYDDAINELLIAERLGLTSYDLYSTLASQYVKKQEFDRALSVADRMLSLQKSAQAHANKCTSRLDL